MMTQANLCNILRLSDLVTEAQADFASAKCYESGHNVLDILLETTALTSDDIAQALARDLHFALESIYSYSFEQACQQLDCRELILKHTALPLALDNDHLIIACSNPADTDAQDDFRFATGLFVRPVLVDHLQLKAAIRKLYGQQLEQQRVKAVSELELQELAELDQLGQDNDQLSDDAPVSRFIQRILLDAVSKKVSDIHFEPFEHNYQIRFRLDGILQHHSAPPVGIARRLATRLKILANLNIAERRLPQDGRIKLDLSSQYTVDMRVSSLPTLWGEKIVLRLLDNNSTTLDIDSLGYNEQQKQAYLTALDKPQGMILVTGPTGSGKTVSLYTGLSYLNSIARNISTAEDPVEINLAGINQVSVNTDIGLNFATTLRAFLRQDPDVIMLGEIRDLETAEISIKAAQTGHLVLSTLHTNSAAETIIRLTSMGVESYNLASSLSLIIAQRLARRLCAHCKQPHDPQDTALQTLAQRYPAMQPTQIFQAHPAGCDHCNHGYLGRVGIYEVMPITREIAQAITERSSIHHIEQLALDAGVSSLPQSGIEKLNQGITSLVELQRVINL